MRVAFKARITLLCDQPPSLKLLRSPDFQRGRGRAATFRANRWGLRLVEAGSDDAKVAQWDEMVSCCAQAGLRVGGGPTRPAGGSVTPRSKETPRGPPPGGCVAAGGARAAVGDADHPVESFKPQRITNVLYAAIARFRSSVSMQGIRQISSSVSSCCPALAGSPRTRKSSPRCS